MRSRTPSLILPHQCPIPPSRTILSWRVPGLSCHVPGRTVVEPLISSDGPARGHVARVRDSNTTSSSTAEDDNMENAGFLPNEGGVRAFGNGVCGRVSSKHEAAGQSRLPPHPVPLSAKMVIQTAGQQVNIIGCGCRRRRRGSLGGSGNVRRTAED